LQIDFEQELTMKCWQLIYEFHWDDLIKCASPIDEKLSVCWLIGGTLGLCRIFKIQGDLLEQLSFNQKYVYYFYDIIQDTF